MLYNWKCRNCNQKWQKAIPIDEYDKEKNKQTCPDCGGHLDRIIEFEGMIGGTGGYDSIAGKGKWQR